MLSPRRVSLLLALSCLAALWSAAPASAARIDLRTSLVPDTTYPRAIVGDANVFAVEVTNPARSLTSGRVTFDLPVRAKLLDVLVSGSNGGGIRHVTCTGTPAGLIEYSCPVRFAGGGTRTEVHVYVGVAAPGSVAVQLAALPGAADRDPTPANARELTSYRASGPTCTVTGANGASAGAASAETLVGTEGPDVLCGFGGRDVCSGNLTGRVRCTSYLPDVIRGLGGDDAVLLPAVNATPTGRTGDSVDLGEGSDTIVNADSTRTLALVSLASARGTLKHVFDVPVGHSVTSAEHYVGSAADERITGTSGANLVEAGGGHDIVDGGEGDDTLRGGAGLDIIAGGTGTDLLDGGAGAEDVAVAGSGGATIDLGLRTITTGTDVDGLLGMEGAAGGAGNDTILGSARNEFLFASGGSDTIDGNGGTDILSLERVFGAVTAGSRIDAARGTVSGGNAIAFSDLEGFVGSRRADVFRGTPGTDVFFGEAGNDVVDGFGGFDVLHGGSGRDTLRGGRGRDECRQDPRSRLYDC